MTIALDAIAPVSAPAAAIPAQARPGLVVSLTDGCDEPLEALKAAPDDHEIRCHPCDEAVVRLLLTRARHAAGLCITPAVAPGTLSLGPAFL